MANDLRLWVRVIGDVQDLERKMSTAERRTFRFGHQMRSIGRGISLGLTAPLTAAGGVAVSAAVEFDRLRRGLETSTGSIEAANRQLAELERIARQPGLGLRQAIAGAVNLNTVLAQLPNSTRLSTRLLEQFGNAIALTGGRAADLDRVTIQLAQMAAAGKVLTQDLRPIIQTAPAVATALRNAFGTISAEEIEALGLSTEEFFNRLLAGLESLPRAAANAGTKWDNFTDRLWRTRARIGGAVLPAFSELLDVTDELLADLEELDPATLRVGVAFGAALAVAGPLTITMGALASATAALSAAGVSLTLALAGPAAVIAALSGVAGLFVKVKLDAAAARAEVARTREEFERLSSSLEGLGPEDVLARVGELRRGEADRIRRLRQIQTLIGGPGRMPELSPDGTRIVKTVEELEAERDMLLALQAALRLAEGAYIRLAKAQRDAADESKAAIDLMPRTHAAFRRLVEIEQELARETDDLRIDLALAAGTEEAAELRKELDETLARLQRVREELAKWPLDTSGLTPEIRRDAAGRPLPVSSIPTLTSLADRINQATSEPEILRLQTLLRAGAGLQSLPARLVEPIAPTRFEAAERMMQKFIEAGLKFDHLPDEIQKEIREAFRERRDVVESYQAVTGGRGLGAGDVGAALSGIGGIVGGRAGGVLGGVGGVITSIASATSPVTMALGVFGGAVSALNSILDTGASRVERVREAWGRLLSFLEHRWNLQDIGVEEQFEDLREQLLQQMRDGKLRDLLAGATRETIQDFIDQVIALFEWADGSEHKIEWLLRAFGDISEEQLWEILHKFKALARETENALSSSLFNVPRWFKVNLERFRATAPDAPIAGAIQPGGTVPTDQGGMVARGGDTITVTGPIHVHGVEDPERFFERLGEIARSRKGRGGASNWDVAFASP